MLIIVMNIPLLRSFCFDWLSCSINISCLTARIRNRTNDRMVIRRALFLLQCNPNGLAQLLSRHFQLDRLKALGLDFQFQASHVNWWQTG
jgi:hypothetical protein